MRLRESLFQAVCGFALAAAGAATARAQEEGGDAPRRTRITLGPQLVPSFPGSDEVSLRPFFDFVRAKGSAPFAFQAPDESFGFAVWDKRGFAVGTALGIAGRRTPEGLGAQLPKIGYSLEIGGFVQQQVTDTIRLRAEVRRGVGGHEGWIADFSADLVARDKDVWLFSVGPRVTVSDDRYHDAYFSVAPLAVAASGLPAFDADGGVQAVGITAGFLRQLSPRWGMASYARYDRLVGDAGASPIVRRLGSRDQVSGGVALTYTFGRFAE